jgi:urease accessory protein
MRLVDQLVPGDTAATATATLTFDDRKKSRQRLMLDDGSEVALMLPRGTVLAAGDRLRGPDGLVVEVRGAPERLSVVRTTDALALARAAYHLGNRHVPLQVLAGEVRYQHDHVLDDMVRRLGLVVEESLESFNPEGGAYGREGGGYVPVPGHEHLLGGRHP